jgi:ATP-dependent DNA helicase RecG
MDLTIEQITKVSGIGEKSAIALNKIGIQSIFDLLLHLPISYQDRTAITPIGCLTIDQYASIKGIVTETRSSFNGSKQLFYVSVADNTGILKLSFFNFRNFQVKQMNVGNELTFFGKVSIFNGQLQMTNPEITTIDENLLTPVYGLTAGIKMFSMRKYISNAINLMHSNGIKELIPTELMPINLSLEQAITFLHNPDKNACAKELEEYKHPAQRRIVLEELISHNLGLIQFKTANHIQVSKLLPKVPDLLNRFLSNLPFTPTKSQIKVFNEISNDLAKSRPMNRLVQGDVGAGKTLVAIMSSLQAIGNGAQVAIMAPTEILAEQHFNNITNLLSPLGFHISILLGKQNIAERRTQLQNIESGKSLVIVGTHAIFQDEVVYKNLQLIIIDEQHRFGVEQRLKLRQKGTIGNIVPHQLTMTATPIPRTLAQTIYADMDISVINELPPGRTPIQTIILSESNKYKLLPRIDEHCRNHRQVYWVCCLINESDTLECQDAENAALFLSQNLPKCKIGVVHGKLKSAEKQKIMNEFKNGTIDILVATSVIEVGVDVPNAFLIVIENAERHGLAQLHQLRGRVGRGKIASYCCLICSNNISSLGIERLKVLKQSNDGFFIAQKDLELRGPGDILGTRQTGDMSFRVANMIRDTEIMDEASAIASTITNKYPERVSQIIERWFPKGEQISGT